MMLLFFHTRFLLCFLLKFLHHFLRFFSFFVTSASCAIIYNIFSLAFVFKIIYSSVLCLLQIKICCNIFKLRTSAFSFILQLIFHVFLSSSLTSPYFSFPQWNATFTLHLLCKLKLFAMFFAPSQP